MPYTIAAAAGAKAKPPVVGRPASIHPRRNWSASSTASSKSPARAAVVSSQVDGQVIRLAEERQLAPLPCVVVGRSQVAGCQAHQRRHVQHVGVLPRHLDLVRPGCEQLEATPDCGDGARELAASELHGGQAVEGGALQLGVAHPAGQLYGAFDELARRRVALVLTAQ